MRNLMYQTHKLACRLEQILRGLGFNDKVGVQLDYDHDLPAVNVNGGSVTISWDRANEMWHIEVATFYPATRWEPEDVDVSTFKFVSTDGQVFYEVSKLIFKDMYAAAFDHIVWAEQADDPYHLIDYIRAGEEGEDI